MVVQKVEMTVVQSVALTVALRDDYLVAEMAIPMVACLAGR